MTILQLLHLADSALPVGSLSHSFGLEALVFEDDLEQDARNCAASLHAYLEDSLTEAMLVDAVFCREAHGQACSGLSVDELNRHLSALRPARETREACTTIGRRFAALSAALHGSPALVRLALAEEMHHSVAFGYTFGILGVEADATVAAYLHQCVLNTISAAQRLMPLGQAQANRIAWDLKPAIMEAVRQSQSESFRTVGSFAHLPELASMRHACLPTRLFVS